MVHSLTKRSDAEFADAQKGKICRIYRPLIHERALNKLEASYYLNEAANCMNSKNANEETRFFVLYAKQKSGNEADFYREFYPMGLVQSIDKEINIGPMGDGSRRQNSQNNIDQRVDSVLAKSRALRKRSNLVREQTVPERKLLPFILPLQNFQSDVVPEQIQNLYKDLPGGQDTIFLLEESRKKISRAHPEHSENKGEKGRAKFSREDDRGLIFTSPGSDRHGQNRLMEIRKISNHQPSCFLKDRVRLGVSIDTCFHFDCAPKNGKLPKKFIDCHYAETDVPRKTHANIAPSDFVR